MFPIHLWSRRHVRILPYILGFTVVCMGYFHFSYIVAEVPSSTQVATASQKYSPSTDLSAVISKRTSRVHKACSYKQKLTERFPTQEEKHLIVDEKSKTMLCYAPKVACTNFKRIFLGLAGVVKPSAVHNISGYDVHFTYLDRLKFLKDYDKEDKKKKTNEYKKFMFVRDPLERLVSAYRSKFAIHPNPDSRAAFLNRIDAFYANFPEREKERNIHNTLKTGAITFKDFLYFIFDHLELQGQVNEHFVPIYDLCNPCKVHYDYIGSYENLIAEANYIFKELSISYHFPAKNDNYSSVETRDIVEAYYTDLPPDLIHSVWEIFKKDYMIFDMPIPTWILKFNFNEKADSGLLKGLKISNHTSNR